ncbi:MAG: NADP-dependent malic enzyme [Rhodobacteraceae bacterium]|nr:NADP-dependent malic enzyme [Paracoccaceae bacterium]
MAEQEKPAKESPALAYHRLPKPGKLEIRATKPLANGRDLARAYSPGVAEASTAIHDDPSKASDYTARGNLVAVVSNGSAVLGLGNIGALASKPVMEGKAVLFKKFANIDCFDIEVDETDPEKLADIVCALEPTFGAINLEDIKAPDCFIVEKLCRERMNIPVFHDDQHGTAIVVGAAATNALRVAGKRFEDIKIVSTGGGAAGIACLDMLLKLGVKRENVWLCDIDGLVYEGRGNSTPQKDAYAQGKSAATLGDVIEGADLFLGLSGPGVLKPEHVEKMATCPIIFALANPTPEILPEDARAVASDAIIATGRSDFPNQVNNVLCFPFIFRGALDVGATEINDAMKIACIEGIAALARATTSAEAAAAYKGEQLSFGADYLIPKPFDPRLMGVVASAVAGAAIGTGVATKEMDVEAYKDRLDGSVFRSALIMRPVFEAASTAARKVVFAEGEDERVLRCAQATLEDLSEFPILIGRPDVIEARCERAGLKIRPGDFDVVNPNDDPRYRDYWNTYHGLMARRGVTPDIARAIMRTNSTAIASVMVAREEADSLICGTFGQYHWHLRYVTEVLSGTAEELHPIGALSMMILEDGPLFLADTHVHDQPTPEQIAETTIAAARHVRRFGVEPQIALLSRSQFGDQDCGTGRTMRGAMEILDSAPRDFVYEGEMHAATALNADNRQRIFPGSRLQQDANVLIFGMADAASGVRNILKYKANGLEVGPILMGMGNRAHIVTPTITARGLLNMTALAGTPVAQYG